MFCGTHEHVLDEKGRTSLPKDFRDVLKELKGKPWITVGPQFLTIFPPREFEAFSSKLADASSTIDSISHLQRLILGNAARCAFDRQGRIFIPAPLRKWASLDREIVIIGVGRRIEVWDRVRHLMDLEQTKMNYPGYTEILKEFGL
jgi:MraZ protein